MHDRERISVILADIDRYCADLKEFQIRSTDDLHDKKTYYAVSMVLFSLLNRVIDLGSEMVMGAALGTPATYRDIFRLLENDGIIDRELNRALSSLVYYRNLLSHEYHTFDESDLMEILTRLPQISYFVQQVRAALR
ncbi:type VII toxin-antitoxin system HepT family RNase toxin [Methanofollis tationis]|uniref:DUF86 domain-containing protein n=1 Tax=Methanofollis tationis TaxID=81417 RepID=A0A7K4HLG3_9EURY|nr:DUF86 domain-containing protein [Methanofollis tationis]NVO66012.1 DUF86 domain-containing protein [Methanofollis tationis]